MKLLQISTGQEGGRGVGGSASFRSIPQRLDSQRRRMVKRREVKMDVNMFLELSRDSQTPHIHLQ